MAEELRAYVRGRAPKLANLGGAGRGGGTGMNLGGSGGIGIPLAMKDTFNFGSDFLLGKSGFGFRVDFGTGAAAAEAAAEVAGAG